MLIDTIDQSYYDEKYYADPVGKSFEAADGSIGTWGYRNPEGEWLGCEPIVAAWNELFAPTNMLDAGCGRGTFASYARDIGIEAVGFDYSDWVVNHLYPRCSKDWVIQHDATQPWPYPDNEFDLVTVLDMMEHIYEEDIDRLIDEIYRVVKKWVFLQIAVSDNGYMFKKGEPIPVELEATAVAGHVTMQPETFWLSRLDRDGWIHRRDLVDRFCQIVDPAVISNWVRNSIIIMERV